jgi:hypothetical protein
MWQIEDAPLTILSHCIRFVSVINYDKLANDSCKHWPVVDQPRLWVPYQVSYSGHSFWYTYFMGQGPPWTLRYFLQKEKFSRTSQNLEFFNKVSFCYQYATTEQLFAEEANRPYFIYQNAQNLLNASPDNKFFKMVIISSTTPIQMCWSLRYFFRFSDVPIRRSRKQDSWLLYLCTRQLTFVPM